MLSLILAASFAGVVASADSVQQMTTMSENRQHRMLPNALQNMCGASYSAALGCGAACPGVSLRCIIHIAAPFTVG